MEFGILENVKTTNKREKIYIPPHLKWIELSNIIDEENDIFKYEIIRLEWQKEFENKKYIEDNFNTLFVRPKNIKYPEPLKEEEINEFK